MNDEKRELISVLLPVMNEVESLNETIRIINSENSNLNMEFLIILSAKSSKESIKNAESLRQSRPESIAVITQIKPMLGGALIDGIENARGGKIIMMASDLETDPRTVSLLIKKSNDFPNAIIATTRWAGDNSGFLGYNPVKLVANKIFQNFIKVLFKCNLTDATFGFRLYPREALAGKTWTTYNFAFLLESMLRPLKSGVKVVEIPTMWRARTEGTSSNSWTYYFSYFKLAAQIRLGK